MSTTLLELEKAREILREGRGEGVKVAVLDSGVETSHPGLEGLRLRDDIAVVAEDHRLAIADGGGVDLYGHGTAIAAIIRNIAPAAEIGSFRVLGERLNSRTAIIAEGARLAIERGYHILNCSFGCSIEEHILHYKSWLDEAYLRGAHVVAACNNIDFQKPEWPGYFPTVVTVNFCRTPSCAQFFYQPGQLVEFVAPGYDVDVPWSGGAFKTVTGSSYAAPHVAGLLARLLGEFPGLHPLEAKVLLMRLAERWPVEAAAANHSPLA